MLAYLKSIHFTIKYISRVGVTATAVITCNHGTCANEITSVRLEEYVTTATPNNNPTNCY
jgi:hypothetical protein